MKPAKDPPVRLGSKSKPVHAMKEGAPPAKNSLIKVDFQYTNEVYRSALLPTVPRIGDRVSWPLRDGWVHDLIWEFNDEGELQRVLVFVGYTMNDTKRP